MRFLSLWMKNFLSHDNTTIPLENQGLVLLSGPNGAGKSAIGEAITWVIYGITPRGLRGDSICRWAFGGRGRKHWISGAKTEVKLELELNGKPVTIHRGRRPNFTKLIVAGEDISCDSPRLTNAKITDLLGIDYEAFCHSVFAPQGADSFVKITDAKKKEVLDQILGTQRFLKARDYLKNKIKTLEDEIRSRREKASSLRDSAKDHLLMQKEATQRMVAFEITRRERVQSLQEERSQLSPPEDMQALRARLLAKEALLCQEQEVNSKAKQSYADAIVNQAKLRAEETELLRQVSILKAKRTAEPQPPENNCAECGQEIPAGVLETLTLQYEKDYRVWAEQERIWAEQETDLTQQGEIVHRKLLLYETLEEPILKNTKDLEQEIAVLTAQIKTWESLELQEQRITLRIHDVLEEENPHKEVRNYHKEKRRLSKRSATMFDQGTETKLKTVEQWKFWEKGFGPEGVRALLMGEALPYFQSRADIYLQALSQKVAYFIMNPQTILQNENHKERISIQARFGAGPATLNSKSGGELQRIAIACLFALRDLALLNSAVSTPDIMFLDEPFESVDKEGAQAVVKLLKTQFKDISTIFVVTHNQDLAAEFEKEIKVKKINRYKWSAHSKVFL